MGHRADDSQHCPGCLCQLREQFVAVLAELMAEQAFEDGELDRLLDDERDRN